MNHPYPSFEELGIDPDFPRIGLRLGASAMRGFEMHGWLEQTAPRRPRTMPEPDPPPEKLRKAYQSRYIGVSRKYTGWRAQWVAGGRYISGPTRKSEIDAARDRAAAMERDYLEVRL